MDIPVELKYITPYVQRGQELATRDPVVSYYAQYYAAKLAIARGPRTKETNEYLSHLLDALETQKKTIGENEAITDDLVGYAHVENFALKIFLNADNEDRSGKSSKKTAKTFLAASIFLELLKTFGDLDPEVEAKIKYSKWKAADIMKALREGRVPTPGSPGEEEQSENIPSISEFPSPPSNFTAPLPPSNTSDVTHTPPQLPKPVTSQPSANSQPHVTAKPPVIFQPTIVANPAVAPQLATPVNLNTVGDAQIASAQKNAKWAISALDYEDIKTARLQLLSALNDIGFNQENNFGF
ncbi:Vta1 like-domain-containing protein [Mucor mucedo]|uniref:Vta1 like-domain-containing protein n=1 Tax=Mucor mucedo TaxID=29922 RepID=UPI00221FC026|nr:Vta1 like-domain-containing protein [Mucor mucedo]KAI7888800.1 Vta1 like-domain-containing protein [Mucor mucedo]